VKAIDWRSVAQTVAFGVGLCFAASVVRAILWILSW
jgi:hypothetical protein